MAVALGITTADLLPVAEPSYDLPVFRDQARKLFETIMAEWDRKTLLLLKSQLARPLESPSAGVETG